MAAKQDSVVALIRDIVRKRDQTLNAMLLVLGAALAVAIATTGPAVAVLLAFDSPAAAGVVGALSTASAGAATWRAVLARRGNNPDRAGLVLEDGRQPAESGTDVP